jgi:DMSO/TMAO reductase YedYZ molybdopterin-dependent catalytic subunit
MRQRRTRGICELYEEDPERADALVFGRRVEADRRGFLKGAGLAAMGAAVGGAVVHARNMPGGLIPAAFAETTQSFTIEGKDGLTVLNDRPVNAETPAHLLDDPVTPNDRHFIRNNGLVPESAEAMDLTQWTLTVDGEVETPLKLNLTELKDRFEVVLRQILIECGGNGRAGFNPPAKGNQWTVGAVGCAEWTGVRYSDVLQAAKPKSSAVYTGHYGSDVHLSGDPEKVVISRGLPMDKAMKGDTLIAFAMNGAPIPSWNGFPVRIAVPGWPGSASQKWLTRITVRDQVHDGPKMTGYSYRVPKYPAAPGERVDEADMKIIEAMPVKSLITHPRSGASHDRGQALAVRGHAWAGDRLVEKVEVSTDYGATWSEAELSAPANDGAWQNWRTELTFPVHGYYEIWARAVDETGLAQPLVVPGWNPRGYLNNSAHRVAVTVG